ncbi:hypothetical protein [Cupriavidus alkaliphilus]
MIYWWIGGLRGAKVARIGLARQKRKWFRAGADDCRLQFEIEGVHKAV